MAADASGATAGSKKTTARNEHIVKDLFIFIFRLLSSNLKEPKKGSLGVFLLPENVGKLIQI
jgi:hypothetical protein